MKGRTDLILNLFFRQLYGLFEDTVDLLKLDALFPVVKRARYDDLFSGVFPATEGEW